MPAVVYQRVTWLSLGKSWEKHSSEWQPRGLRSSLENTIIVRCICIVQEIEVIYGHSMEGLLITVCHARDDGSCVYEEVARSCHSFPGVATASNK